MKCFYFLEPGNGGQGPTECNTTLPDRDRCGPKMMADCVCLVWIGAESLLTGGILTTETHLLTQTKNMLSYEREGGISGYLPLEKPKHNL